MRSAWWLVGIVATGCGGGIKSTRDAPFTIGALKASLWSIATASDDESQSAILALSDVETECVVLDGKPLSEAIDVLTREGKGLLFFLNQEAAADGAVLEWTGTWTDGGGNLPGGNSNWGYRELSVSPFETGVFYDYYSAVDHWIRLDEVSDDVRGEFWTTFWSGSFKAESCGGWEAGDTGYTTPYSSL